MSGNRVMIRRWNSAPLDPTPKPPRFIVHNDQEDALVNNDNKLNDIAEEPQQQTHGKESSPSQTASSSGVDKDDDVVVQETNRQGRGCGRGIIADYRETLGTWWCKEMTNFNQKTIAVSFFLFFACIAPAITFGAVYGKATQNRIGAVEMIVATSWCGIVYALIGGQPMMINGGTGPVLAFAEIIFKMSKSMDVPFLTFNAWIGLWVGFFMMLAAFGNLNRFIKYATRFTDEIFALLIATIFIINALGNPFSPTGIYWYFEEDHKSHEEYGEDDDYSHTAVALLSFVVCIGTVQVAFFLRGIKFSPFLPTQGTRNIVTDFAVVTSILLWTLLSDLLFEYVPLETLNVPETVAPTLECCTAACDSSWPLDCPDLEQSYGRRPWLVDLLDLNGKTWVPFMAAGPAILAFILVFLDDGITWHLINHPAHKLSHGSAYDYDTVIIGIMVAVNGMFGLPFLVAATVRSQNHVHALAEKDAQGRILSVQQTRLTHLLIHVLCLASIFALDALKLIPMPVLYGVFLFMGLVSLGSNTLWGRFLMLFMQPSKYPLEPYTMHMRPKRMHLFTVIQLSLFGLLYAVKAIKTIAIAFPLVIACCIPIRLYILPKIFTEKELVMIDGDDDEVKKWFLLNRETTFGGGDDDDDDVQAIAETHHAGELEEFAVVADVIELPAKEAPSTDIETGSTEQQPTSSLERKQRRRNRKKSLSCPTPHLFFAEPPHGDEPQVAIGLAVVHEDIHEEETPPVSQTEVDGVEEAADTGTIRRRRPRRVKTMSCPAHLLFAEGERQVNENYFFG